MGGTAEEAPPAFHCQMEQHKLGWAQAGHFTDEFSAPFLGAFVLRVISFSSEMQGDSSWENSTGVGGFF